MENLLLRHCRQQAGCSPEQTATALGIELSAYTAIESGRLLPSGAQALQLGKLFGIDPEVLQATSLQLELLHTAHELIKRQEWLIEILSALALRLPDKASV